MRGVRIGAAPALCLGQEAGSTGEGTSTPAANTPAAINAPGGAAPVAVLPGTSMPGEAVPFGGLRGLRSLPAEYTNNHVSPGLGTTFVPFRLFARPEVTELVLRRMP